MSACQLLEDWVVQMQALVATLDAEFAALTNKNIDMIEAQAQRKAQQIDQLSALEKQLIQLLPDVPLHALFSHLIETCHDQPASQHVKALAIEVQQANQRNGTLLHAMIRLNEYGLNILTGKMDTSGTYGASGQIQNSSTTSPIKLATA